MDKFGLDKKDFASYKEYRREYNRLSAQILNDNNSSTITIKFTDLGQLEPLQ